METQKHIQSQKKFFRLANYIGAAQLYLKDNFLLEKPLKKEHIKDRILGHWGTVPGINFIYLHLNEIARKHEQKTLLITGPGHGYPALLSNLYIEGSLGEKYPNYTRGKKGMGKLIHDFSWPGGFPSHANPETPGAILEGGELGYSLSTAFGACFDNPDLLVAAIIGDGEAESGPLAASWQSNKFLNPISDGAVLPIVHINKYKISGPTIFGSMSRRELENYFIGLGYDPIIVYATDEGVGAFESMNTSMEYAYLKIREIQKRAREDKETRTPRWPVLLLVSRKGWTIQETFEGEMIEDSFHSHGIPYGKVKEDESQFQALKEWLESYKVHELVDKKGNPIPEILDLLPPDHLKLGNSPHANGGDLRIALKMPKNEGLCIPVDTKNRGAILDSNTAELGKYLSDIVALNPHNFRIMCPDETESNKLGALFEQTTRRYMWPVPEGSKDISTDGRVMEILSEHTLQGWMEGYILTGRHSIFITYEAFAMIIASMVDQYNKFLIQSDSIGWRKPVSSMNFVLTSTSWRQDHNGFSHQNPGFVSSQLNNNSQHVSIYYPLDANMMLVTLDKALSETNKINIIIAGKRKLPQYMTLEEAQECHQKGLVHLDWAGNNPEQADITMCATGDYAAQETFAAILLLKKYAPDLNTRMVYVSQLSCFSFGGCSANCINPNEFEKYYGKNTPIIYSYHGYTQDLKQLLFDLPDSSRFSLHGYEEKGTTTTPFDMLVKNRSSRYDLAIDALKKAVARDPEHADSLKKVEKEFEKLLERHKEYIIEHGHDLSEVRDFKIAF